jgi:hypothetical protein
VQLSSVQSTPSSHSLAEQQLPQLAAVPSGLGQHLSPGAHSEAVLHLPAWQMPIVHGSVSVSHCLSLQHSSAQPVSQHSLPAAQNSLAQ